MYTGEMVLVEDIRSIAIACKWLMVDDELLDAIEHYLVR